MEIFKNWLRANGVKFEEETFGLTFKYQGGAFIIFNNGNDKRYLNLAMPNIWEIGNDETKAFKVANKINCDIKAVKTTIRDNDVWLSIEMFIDSTPNIEDFMDRILGILLECRIRFGMEMNK